MNSESLERRLLALARRVMLLGGSAAVGWAVVTVFVLAIVAAWFDLLWELSPRVRIGFDGLLIVGGVAAIGIGLWRAWTRTARPALARRLDRTAGGGGEILTGYELSQPGSVRDKSEPLTEGLATIAVSRAAALADSIPPAKVVPVAGLKHVGIGLAATALAAGGLALFCADLVATQSLRFFDPMGDHPPYSRTVFHVEPGDVKVLYGGGLDVCVTTEGPPPQRVELVLAGNEAQREEVLPMFQGREGQWRTVLARVTNDAHYYVRAWRSRSHRYQIDVITIPKLVDVKFRVVQPDYAHRAVYQGVMPKGGIAGLAGTQVQVWAESNRPLEHGMLKLTAEGRDQEVRLEPTAGAPETVTGTFEIHAGGQFELDVTDVAGHASREKFSGSVVLLPDEKPLVRMLQPPATAYATPEATLPAIASGEDDCGIATLQLYRSLNDSRALPISLELPRIAPVRFDGEQVLPLSVYGLQPGDVIKLFARVEDNDPAGAKGAESAIVTVQIISQQDFERMQRMREGLEALASKYRQAERRLENLAAETEKLEKELEKDLENGDQLSEEKQKAMEKLADELREEAQAIRESAKHLLPFDLDPALVDRLKELADKVETAADRLDVANEQNLGGASALDQLKQLKQELAQGKEEFKKEATDPIEHLEKIFPLIEDEARFTRLYELQRDLAHRLESLKGMDKDNTSQVKARMRNLEEEQNRLREEANTLVDDIETHISHLPEDERLNDLRDTATKFAEALRTSGAGEAMLEAESGLVEFSGTSGHAGADKAADILESLMGKCKGMEGEGKACLKFAPKLEQALGNTIQQLLAEAGLGRNGEGGNGYSMRRSSLNNVGLFGNLPGVDPRSGKGFGAGMPGGGGLDDGSGGPANASQLSGQNRGTASGAAADSVPPRYRSRVGAYFQRIAEETPAE